MTEKFIISLTKKSERRLDKLILENCPPNLSLSRTKIQDLIKQNMIFDPFYQIEKSRFRDSNHYGLGLNLCRTIIEAHDGNLWVESEEGSGSTFFLEIPMNLQSKD